MTLNDLLKPTFTAKHVSSAARHFEKMVEDFQKSDWEDSSAKAGKLIEAIVKALWVYVGETVPAGKDFKVGTLLDKLQNKPATSVPERIRITIPRACRFAYEIASNRGARHDVNEIDANEMDARVVLSVCCWILAEMVSFSQKGVDLAQAKSIVEGLMKRRFPFTEEIEGRVYVDIAQSAKEVALLILWTIYPRRMQKTELEASVMRHDYTEKNARVAVSRIVPYVDDDGTGNLKLRNSGLKKAEEMISKASSK
jgi:HEPN domain-containing protein